MPFPYEQGKENRMSWAQLHYREGCKFRPWVLVTAVSRELSRHYDKKWSEKDRSFKFFKYLSITSSDKCAWNGLSNDLSAVPRRVPMCALCFSPQGGASANKVATFPGDK